ncbi:MAG: transglutaminase family protein [Elainellaceae cyanobacterium]
MRYKIDHTTLYTYDRPVMLDSHVLRLRPRSDMTQKLGLFSLEIDPKPEKIVENVDLDGNDVIQIWFSSQKATASLNVRVSSEVETFRSNPFDFLLEKWATTLPIDYPNSLLQQLRPYLSHSQDFPFTTDPIANELAQDICLSTDRDTVSFLSELNQRIHDHCQYGVRETGAPQPPSMTWKQKAGSCRDFAVLFMEACQAIGLAARFVSGYQEGDPEIDECQLHAWAEVYLPGAGWHGYDPTNAVAVSDRHIALVASPFSQKTIPVKGSLKAEGYRAKSEMTYHLTVQRLENEFPQH